MEGKADKLLRKIHIKDYTNSLEKVLERKYFSIDTKNLLLSMLYKIENAYKDYEKTKVEVINKSDFLEKVISIIEQKCDEIITKNDIDKEFMVEKENGKIVTIGNELSLLENILKMGESEIILTEEELALSSSINNFFNNATIINQAEIIRDFNGWSWDISVKDIKNISINLVYQILIYLFGNEFIQNWSNNISPLADYLMLAYDNLKDNFGEKRAENIIKIFCEISIEENIKNNEKELEFWQQKTKETEIELEKLNNNVCYLEEITNEKKKIAKEIEKIDKIINNQDLLKKEYNSRNSRLQNEEKIFSVRQLINKMESERQEHVNQIKKYNELLDPKKYVSRKEKISKKYEFLKMINFNADKQKTEKELLSLCKLFLECFKIKVEKASTKQKIINYIYELRYFSFLMFDEKSSIKELSLLKNELEKVIKIIYNKARNMNVIEDVTKDEEANYKIVKKIFDSKMIDLNNMVIKTQVKDGRLYIEYYDTNILEGVVELQSDKTIKLNKKTKLFI